MNLFENLQIMKESGNLMSNDEFVKNECEKYGINEYSYGTNYKMLELDPTDSSAEEFINKIEADGYKFIEEQKDGIENHESENDVTLVYGKEVEGNRCIIAISIHPSENYTIVSCGYDKEEHDNEFFENLQLMKEANNNYELPDKFTRSSLMSFVLTHNEVPVKFMRESDWEKCVIVPAYDKYLKLINLLKQNLIEDGLYDRSYIGMYVGKDEKPPYSTYMLPIYGNAERYVTKWFRRTKEEAIKDLMSRAGGQTSLLDVANNYLEYIKNS